MSLSAPMTPSILNQFISAKKSGLKSFAVLIDPDKTDPAACLQLIRNSIENKVSFFFVGGSLITGNHMGQIIKQIKANSSIPVILFPGSNLHIDMSADAILFLSLISGRNPDLLIGQHVIAAPILKKAVWRFCLLAIFWWIAVSKLQFHISVILCLFPTISLK